LEVGHPKPLEIDMKYRVIKSTVANGVVRGVGEILELSDFAGKELMAYGKVVADALEKGIQTDDLLTDAAMLILPKYDVADVEFRVDIKCRHGYVTLLAKPDSLDSRTKAFYEYKTGKVPWTQTKAQNHLQMWLYALSIYVAPRRISKSELIWIETTTDGNVVTPTGRIESFPVTFTVPELLKVMALVGRVAREIEIAYAAHVPNKAIMEY